MLQGFTLHRYCKQSVCVRDDDVDDDDDDDDDDIVVIVIDVVDVDVVVVLVPQGKASTVDLEAKADRYEVQTLLKGKVSAAEMSNKVDIEELEAVRESCETRILSLQDELDGLRAELRSSVTREEVIAWAVNGTCCLIRLTH